jgi:hypothetical protein
VKSEERTVAVSGMEALELQPGDLMNLGGGEWVRVVRVHSATRITVGPVPLWQRFVLFFEWAALEVKIWWWGLRLDLRQKWGKRK